MIAPLIVSEKAGHLMFNYTFHWNQALKALPQLLDGAVVTLQIAILSMVIGLTFAIALTLFRLSGNRIMALSPPSGWKSPATRRRCSRFTWPISALAISAFI